MEDTAGTQLTFQHQDNSVLLIFVGRQSIYFASISSKLWLSCGRTIPMVLKNRDSQSQVKLKTTTADP